MPSPHEIQILPFFPPSGAVTRASGASHFAISVPSVTARKTSSGEASSSTESSMSRVFLFMAVGSFLIGVWRLWVGERNDAMHASARSGLVVVLGGEPRDLARKLLREGGTIRRRRGTDFCLERERREALGGIVRRLAQARHLAKRARRDRDDVCRGEPIRCFRRALRE